MTPQGLRHITETTMVEAHKAGQAYYLRNRPADAKDTELLTLAHSCGWYADDAAAWLAGFYGAMRRAANGGI